MTNDDEDNDWRYSSEGDLDPDLTEEAGYSGWDAPRRRMAAIASYGASNVGSGSRNSSTQFRGSSKNSQRRKSVWILRSGYLPRDR